jgi:hypothetical protein
LKRDRYRRARVREQDEQELFGGLSMDYSRILLYTNDDLMGRLRRACRRSRGFRIISKWICRTIANRTPERRLFSRARSQVLLECCFECSNSLWFRKFGHCLPSFNLILKPWSSGAHRMISGIDGLDCLISLTHTHTHTHTLSLSLSLSRSKKTV